MKLENENNQTENLVYVECPMFTIEDFETLSKCKEINFKKAYVLHYEPLPLCAIMVIYELANNIGYSAVYDIIKYSLSKLFEVFSKKSKKNGKIQEKFMLRYDEHIFSFETSFPLSDDQKEMLINKAINSITKDN